MQYKSINKEEWDKTLEQLLLSYTIFASVSNAFGQDYELIGPADIAKISYNKPKPATSLKSFFLPVKENVTSERVDEKPRIILGIPNCDIEGLCLLDEIYLDKEFNDIFYRKRREDTLLISSDCIGIQEHCHCLSYNIKPYSAKNADLAVINLDGTIVLRIITGKGEDFIKNIPAAKSLEDKTIISAIEKEQLATEKLLATSNKGLPDYKLTGKLVTEAKEEIWEKYSARCVSCGACTTICPTCTCFLLIDKPGFEKIKQMDACQYPGFERVAGGKDALHELSNRFRNRYMCKYLWKPKKFKSLACTGCGRCIEACIGKINKNELFMELAE
ncbi:MAG: 4Fe-4S dicluster domain-containing protein [Bacteroidia bacterium]|nr:4Fe-4S dicluster domain-containing protein [Bacteroidia bacterium]